MNGLSWKRIRVLLLALVLAGMGLTLVQGGLMAAEMAVAAEASVPSGCDACGGGDHGDSDIGTCLSVCGSAHGLLPGEPVAFVPASPALFQTARPAFGGRIHAPDHGPPKVLTLR